MSANAPQRIVKIRRDYNTWVANESLEDYALRFTPHSFRKWSEFRVANTAFGAVSFLVIEAVGAAITINYGFVNAFWAIITIGLFIFLTGLPISYYASRYGVDMDLLTRGAGFGYIGSTITSLVYASFTFIFMALEAAIMAYALELYFGIPPSLGYLISAVVVIPLATHGVTLISRLQSWTQPVWLVMLALPYVFVIYKNPGVIAALLNYAGKSGTGNEFNLLMFGAATTVCFGMIAQIGEQVDYLRFMPALTKNNRFKWFSCMLLAGPGWILLGMMKMMGGALLAFMLIKSGVSLNKAIEPNQMYFLGYKEVFNNTQWALAASMLFVVISQIKINVTNAYAGSLAWSNFFARLTHSHPGRVVWMVFNVLIALLLMELGVFQVLDQVLGLYGNVAISWIGAVVADLVINKPLGLSPKGIEFKRAYLHDINPVGVGAMLIATAFSVAAFTGAFGEMLQAFSAFVALLTAFVTAPLIAWYTKGKYYLARPPETRTDKISKQCSICEKSYETEDMAFCPAYQGSICSLCCSLDARCHDVCKPKASLADQWSAMVRVFLPKPLQPYVQTGLGHYLLLMSLILALFAALLSLIYYHEGLILGGVTPLVLPQMKIAFIKIFAGLLIVSAIGSWWLVLTSRSRKVAQEESNRQTSLLLHEIEAHRLTDAQLQAAKLAADRANSAKSRYISGISHELRTPLNSILGYAQILGQDASIPKHRKEAVNVIRRSGEHLLSVIDGTLDIASIETGKLTLDVDEIRFPDFVKQIAGMFELQARNKGIEFSYEPTSELPEVVRADKKRLGQILINILGNAVKFTQRGKVAFRLSYLREIALFEVEDTGAGILPEELELIFQPFARGRAADRVGVGGTGLGLTISKMLTDLMGGELNIKPVPTGGSLFLIRLFLPHVRSPRGLTETPMIMMSGYTGPRRKILIVDNEEVDRELISNMLAPLGFDVEHAATGVDCLGKCANLKPDLILMDLAMPGIDGWETSRLLRHSRISNAPIIIISANAFDKGRDNAAGISNEDFLLKPVNVFQLLDRIGKRLQLEWVYPVAGETIEPQSGIETVINLPPPEYLQALRELIVLGYVRGIHEKLDEIELLDADYEEFIEIVRTCARQFRLDSAIAFLQRMEQHATD